MRLGKDEVAKVRFALKNQYGIDASESDIDDVWKDFYPTHWIADLQYRAKDCRRCYHKFKSGKICRRMIFRSREPIRKIISNFFLKPKSGLG